MLGVANLMGAVVIVSRVSTFLKGDPEVDPDTLESLHEWFGSVGIATEHFLFASTGSTGWSDYYIALGEMSVVDKIIYLLVILFIQLGLLNIILGIFVDSALKALDPGPIERAEEHSQDEAEIQSTLEKIMEMADVDENGRLSLDEFDRKISGSVYKFLDMLGFRHDHVRSFLRFLQSKDPSQKGVDVQEFVQGCMLLKGTASNWEVRSLRVELDEVKRMIACQPTARMLAQKKRASAGFASSLHELDPKKTTSIEQAPPPHNSEPKQPESTEVDTSPCPREWEQIRARSGRWAKGKQDTWNWRWSQMALKESVTGSAASATRNNAS
jgi:hypothetical protein